MAKGYKTGGRKPGSRNKATLAGAQTMRSALGNGLTPLAHMLKVLRDRKLPRAERMEAAKAAAPYVHPKLQSTILSGTGAGGAIELIYSTDDMAL